MTRERTAGEIREDEKRREEHEWRLLKAAREHLWRIAAPGTAINLDHARALINGGAKDHRSYFMWARFVVAGWESYGLPADVLEAALQSTRAELDTFRPGTLFWEWSTTDLARALGRSPAPRGVEADITDPDTLRLVEKLAASLDMKQTASGKWQYHL